MFRFLARAQNGFFYEIDLSSILRGILIVQLQQRHESDLVNTKCVVTVDFVLNDNSDFLESKAVFYFL